MREICEAKHWNRAIISTVILGEEGWSLKFVVILKVSFCKFLFIFTMPNSCCAVGCTNRKTGRPELTFYSFPSSKKNANQRSLWVNAMKRVNWPEEQINNANIWESEIY